MAGAALAEPEQTGLAQGVHLINPTEIDTYNSVSYESSQESLKTKFAMPFVSQIVTYNDPDSWPNGLRTEEQRAKRYAEIQGYAAYQIAVLPDGDALLWIPADENQGMAPKLVPAHDLFVMVRPGGLMQANGTRALPDGSLLPPPIVVPSVDVATFGSQLDALIVALATDFASIKGAVIPNPNSILPMLEPTVYASTTPLDGAFSTSFWGTGAAATLVADYGDYDDPTQADAIVETLIAAVDAAPKPCCILVKDRLVNQVFVTTYYLPFDPSHQMAPGLASMVLEIEFHKHLAMDVNNKLVDRYSVNLKIHRQ